MADLRLFRREVAVTIARPTDYFRSTALTVVRDLRVDFQIDRTIGKEPNKCDVTIYNLAADTAGELAQKPAGLRLDAGYDGGLARLFEGDVRFARTARRDADNVTEAQVGDGDRAFKFARVGRAYRAGVSLRTLVEDAARAMGLAVPATLEGYAELQRQFAQGAALFGPAQAELSRVLAAAGLSWSIQDGALQVLRTADTRNEAPEEVSQATGMVGAPELGAPTTKGKPPVLSCRVLLRPTIKPGGRIRVDGRNVAGLYKVQRVLHKGSTHGDDWHSLIEAIPV
jgi:hypothetical protein